MVMAPTHTTSSPRDHVADANPDVARKKQRFSDEDKEESADDVVVIETYRADDAGANIANPIEIEDDISVIMAPYSDSFNITSDQRSPLEQITSLRTDLQQNLYIHPNVFIALSRWLTDHINTTINDGHEWKQHYLVDESEFFTRFALVAIELVDAGELFEPSIDMNAGFIRGELEDFLIGLEALCHRIVPFMREATKVTLSRRDSVQISTGQQVLGSLYYVVVAHRIVSLDTKTFRPLHRNDKRDRLYLATIQNRGRFFERSTLASLAAIIHTLSGVMREIKDSWTFQHHALMLFKMGISMQRRALLFCKSEIQEVLEVINSSILPAICEKHPRALPDGFYPALFNLAKEALQIYVEMGGEESASSLYERFVKRDGDAVIPKTATDESVSTSLHNVCVGDLKVLGRILSLSWTLQATNAFIRSDIMDVRNCGVMLCKETLVNLYEEERNGVVGLKHPVVQHAVRFLRENELTAYIFGPESRAGLVRHSTDIMCFLAATSQHSDTETDIVWRACTTSVEADFVKASFYVLVSLMRFLDFQSLIYIAKKYSTAQVDKLDLDAIGALEALFKAIEERDTQQKGSSNTLTVALTSLEILKAANVSGHGPVKEGIRHFCLNEIGRFTSSHITVEKEAIYEHCMPEIRDRTEYATTAVEVLTLFLNVGIQPGEAELILKMLPVSEAVDEFCSFVQGINSQRHARSNIPAAILRLGYITCLMALTPSDVVETTRDRLFEFAFGASALCGEARNRAWMQLHDMATTNNVPSAASSLWRSYMRDSVPSLRVDLATPKLIEFISSSLKTEFHAESTDVKCDPVQLLDLPLWKTLVRFATTSSDHHVINVAINVIIDLLFKYPSSIRMPPSLVASCQTEFVRIHIRSLCEDYEELLQTSEQRDPRKFLQGINLLDALLAQSRETASIYAPAAEPEDLVLDGSNGDADSIKFTAHVHGADVLPKPIFVHARRDTKVSDLIAVLPQRTGATENRIIASGKEVSLVPDRTLSEVGVQQSGVAMIRPKYTFGLNIEQVLTCPGPVEQEIMNQFDTLDSFLDGPELIAQNVYLFLTNVRQCPQARFKVSAPSATATDLFPADRLWRSVFSLNALQRHLSDFARLGVADNTFIDRTIRLLASVVLDESRPFQPFFVYEMSGTLLAFFEERTHGGDSAEINDLQSGFVTRMISLIFEGLSRISDHDVIPHGRRLRFNTVETTYKALLAACRQLPGLWTIFSQEPNIVKLHESLLLDYDMELSSCVAVYIKGFCYGPGASHIPTFYWQAIIPSLREALRRGSLSDTYFAVAVDVLHADLTTQADEDKIRGIISNLTSELWSYHHGESIELPVQDKAVTGLLRLLGVAITILKSHKKPLELQGLSSRVLAQLLFPPVHDPERHPLITQGSRNHAYDLVRWSFEPKLDYDNATRNACEAIHASSRELGASYPGLNDWFRPPWVAAGLMNLGMTCYMNSLLQQLFANLQFRKFILEQPIHDTQRFGPLSQVRELFGRMQDHTPPSADTASLAQALNIQVGNQEDVHTFYTTLLSRLEDNIPDNSGKAALNKFFTGKSLTQVKGECGHVSSRTEAFTELSVTVKNKGSLAESLDEFVQGEPLEGANKYMCMTCDSDDGGRLVNAMRRTCLEDVPDNLTFCLKRFTYETMVEGENKVNDRFEFPSTVDISLYKRSYLEAPNAPRIPDEFELVGVIVHQGSLQFGHYWSYIRVPGPADPASSMWLCLEDTRCLRIAGGVQEVQELCFGGPKVPDGNERPDSAYVLFYQRRSYIAEANAINIVPQHLQAVCNMQPRVELPEMLAQEISTSNRWRQHIESLFDAQFGSFVVWLIGQSQSVIERRKPDPDDTMQSTREVESDEQSVGEVETRLGDLIANYTMRILLADPSADDTVAGNRLESFMTSLMTLIETDANIASHILRFFCSTGGFGFANVVRNSNAKVRSRVFEGIWSCMSHLREHDLQLYNDHLKMIIDSHASVIGISLDEAQGKWDEYFAFATRFAHLGFRETGMVLERGYLEWILDILQIRYDVEKRRAHISLFNWMRSNTIDLSGLYNFIFHLLDRHVDLAEPLESLPDSFDERTSTPQGWCLRQDEVGLLMKDKHFAQHHKLGLLFIAGTRNCLQPTRWEDYAPGKVLGLLVSEKVDFEILDFVEGYMVAQFEFEDSDLRGLLYLMLHYCLNRPDQDCKGMMSTFTRNLLLWEGSEKEILEFYEKASKLAPVSVIESIPMWVWEFFSKRKQSVRQKAAAWLHDHLFEPTPLSENPMLDAARIRITRTIAVHFMETLRLAYNNEHNRGRYDVVISVLEDAAVYLNKLQEGVAQQRQDGTRIGHEILVEHDESRAALTAVLQYLKDIKNWEGETTLPTRSIDVRRSVEGDSEESETSCVEAEDDMSSEHELA